MNKLELDTGYRILVALMTRDTQQLVLFINISKLFRIRCSSNNALHLERNVLFRFLERSNWMLILACAVYMLF